MTINQSAKSFIAEKYNTWFSGEVTKQLMQGQDPCDVKVPLQLTVIKPLHAKWILELYNRLKGEKGLIRNGFVAAGITEAIDASPFPRIVVPLTNWCMHHYPELLVHAPLSGGGGGGKICQKTFETFETYTYKQCSVFLWVHRYPGDMFSDF